jgi:type IV pilus assembly protein PilX
MKPTLHVPAFARKQRGVALFFALVCLGAIMLAAVILVRSVDTATLISGNLAFQQSATRSGDAGSDAAIAWLQTTQAANSTKNVLEDATHAFNVDNAVAGYYASVDLTKSLTATSGTRFLWDNTDSVALPVDSSGNQVRYIIQRMCRTSTIVKNASCLYSSADVDASGQHIKLLQEICDGAGCPAGGQTPQIRITTRITGPKNTVSYVQAIVF